MRLSKVQSNISQINMFAIVDLHYWDGILSYVIMLSKWLANKKCIVILL